MTYKTELKDVIVFKLPIDFYNQMLENISIHLEEFNNKLGDSLEGYNKMASNISTAIEVLSKQTVVDLDSINVLISSMNRII
jgi:hypothetical protein